MTAVQVSHSPTLTARAGRPAASLVDPGPSRCIDHNDTRCGTSTLQVVPGIDHDAFEQLDELNFNESSAASVERKSGFYADLYASGLRFPLAATLRGKCPLGESWPQLNAAVPSGQKPAPGKTEPDVHADPPVVSSSCTSSNSTEQQT